MRKTYRTLSRSMRRLAWKSCSRALFPYQHQGTSGETYKLDAVALAEAHQHLQSADKASRKTPDKHDLLTLFHAMLEAIRSSLALDSQEGSFERFRDVFTNSRYRYESSSGNFPTR
ncbi:hypothetical protein D3C76_327170 [compost metagenome]|uniref:Uncharacterized protein n=1 Tax=Pseudomonas fluorescens TaxID=294 RepID=A0A5E7T8S3_PSEFL|nr:MULTISPECIES: hypothetical protein [Pseudomonas]PBJ27498.1 hypothetical protein BSF44_05250 [Pseudomonas sp. ACN8]VVP94929.1 hypothetical protein PS938_01936 [Pseudomonas fluorescens]HKO96171.1 hypothetical protein [Pyrinomonadaceae bacterium]